MKRINILHLLIRPSLFSFLSVLFVTLFILIGSSWSYVLHSPVFFNYFYGPDGLATALQNSPNSFSAFTHALLAGSWTYNVLVLVIAVAVGFGVYIFLEGFDHLAMAARNLLPGARTVGNAKDAQIESGVRLSVRILSFIVWVAYLISFSKIILPFSILVFRTGVDRPFTLDGTADIVVGFIVLLFALHLHVILLRLLTLRLRIFGIPSGDIYT